MKELKIKTLGTENLVAVFVAVLEIASNLRALFKDFSYAKLAQFAVGLVQYASIISAARQAWDEFQSLSVEKANDVERMVRQEFDIPDDDFEEAIEEAIGLVVDTYEWVQQGAELGGKYVAYYNKYIKGEKSDTLPGDTVSPIKK